MGIIISHINKLRVKNSLYYYFVNLTFREMFMITNNLLLLLIYDCLVSQFLYILPVEICDSNVRIVKC